MDKYLANKYLEKNPYNLGQYDTLYKYYRLKLLFIFYIFKGIQQNVKPIVQLYKYHTPCTCCCKYHVCTNYCNFVILLNIFQQIADILFP